MSRSGPFMFLSIFKCDLECDDDLLGGFKYAFHCFLPLRRQKRKVRIGSERLLLYSYYDIRCTSFLLVSSFHCPFIFCSAPSEPVCLQIEDGENLGNVGILERTLALALQSLLQHPGVVKSMQFFQLNIQETDRNSLNLDLRISEIHVSLSEVLCPIINGLESFLDILWEPVPTWDLPVYHFWAGFLLPCTNQCFAATYIHRTYCLDLINQLEININQCIQCWLITTINPWLIEVWLDISCTGRSRYGLPGPPVSPRHSCATIPWRLSSDLDLGITGIKLAKVTRCYKYFPSKAIQKLNFLKNKLKSDLFGIFLVIVLAKSCQL